MQERKNTKQTSMCSSEKIRDKHIAAIYPGSFDPVTFGHLDVVKRASEMFDEIVVAVLNNHGKTPLFSINERVKMMKEATKDIPNVRVEAYSGLTMEFAKQQDIHILIRGLRAITDFEYELQIAQTNRKMSGGQLDSVFLTTSLEYAYLSSTIVKEIASYGGDISQCVPDFVVDSIYNKFGITKQ